ncbi:LegC family aminotransferase [Clostridium botulinum C]|uniref:LegC family aminotransferase n=2 Tax=Clostridium botulinum TaxID=1491 RepID=A0A9Q4XS99_CLOBO|nr:LegC family aminotransferase [Clostridium botulinum]MCD3193985.1 LegC family aminotransferase [Clostridium botulinum C]MCD3199386.1 LegC family aminotransferase [Clostridium botulinum C]MCD3204861.1 LegC family aminotransferase [Clostridium botulinum C]MCD3207686.1 LegC family aminotransferase [Clostridium botulinum C]MCD3224856.1 LegC family aminotransferase [Clostridium botulinum C]
MIPLCIPDIRGNEWKYVKECIDTNWVSSVGSYVNLFEEKFAEYLSAHSAVVTINGTAAIELALLTLGIGLEDEVIVPSMTFISPVNTVKYVGATPVFCDVCRDTFVMDASKIEELITPKTKAIIPVHIYGHPVDMDKVMELAKKYNLYVIEDATEALGSKYKGKSVGTIGDIGAFSFNGNKLITTGAGGMLVTNSEEYGSRAKFLSTQTKVVLDNKAFYHPEVGYNFRMPNLLAAFGVAQLENIDEYLKIKKENADYYNKLLKDVKGITLPIEKEWAKNCYWLYSILVEDDFKVTRDELIKILSENGIESRPFFMPVHDMPPYVDCLHGSMDVTNEISAKGINIPSSVSLTKENIEFICSVIKSI